MLLKVLEKIELEIRVGFPGEGEEEGDLLGGFCYLGEGGGGGEMVVK